MTEYDRIVIVVRTDDEPTGAQERGYDRLKKELAEVFGLACRSLDSRRGATFEVEFDPSGGA